MGLWVLLLIRCSTFTFLSDVGHITHTCTQQSEDTPSDNTSLLDKFERHVLSIFYNESLEQNFEGSTFFSY